MSRRRFVQQLAVAGVALAFGRGSVAATERSATVAVGPVYSAFTGRIGHRFSLTSETAGNATLKLAEVDRPKQLRGYPDAAKARELCFTLVFDGDADSRLAEGIYRFSAVGMEPFDAFVSPLRGEKTLRYQVVFNRI